MNKVEKREIIKNLITSFNDTKDIARLIQLRNDIITEVFHCGYKDSKVYNIIMPRLAGDVDSHIYAIANKQGNEELNRKTGEALIGMFNLIEVSQLAD
jgi:hypothetical protein